MSKAQQARAIKKSKTRIKKSYFHDIRLNELRICLLTHRIFRDSHTLEDLLVIPVCPRAAVPMNKRMFLQIVF